MKVFINDTRTHEETLGVETLLSPSRACRDRAGRRVVQGCGRNKCAGQKCQQGLGWQVAKVVRGWKGGEKAKIILLKL